MERRHQLEHQLDDLQRVTPAFPAALCTINPTVRWLRSFGFITAQPSLADKLCTAKTTVRWLRLFNFITAQPSKKS